jgi:hypothetical protein
LPWIASENFAAFHAGCALRKWAAAFAQKFPTEQELTESQRGYWNWKIPVDVRLVEGSQATADVQRACAQLIIDGCASLLSVKPAWAAAYRVTGLVCLPNMFSSEICLYLDELYFRSKVDPDSTQDGHQERIEGRSLASEWGLTLPDGVAEMGTLWRYDASEDANDHDISDHWMYDEVC